MEPAIFASFHLSSIKFENFSLQTPDLCILHVSMETRGRVPGKFWVINTLEAFLAIENSFETSFLATWKSVIFQEKDYFTKSNIYKLT